MQTILNQLKIKAQVVDVQNNGTMTKYFLQMLPGAKVSKIENCATEIALGLKAYSKPFVRVIPHEGLVSVELLTKPLDLIKWSDLTWKIKQSDYEIPIGLGKSHDGEDVIADLSTMPHLLVAGATGSGKSIMLHSIINSLMMMKEDVNIALIDPKKVEFTYYSDIEHLKYPVITEPEDALEALSDLVNEMENRFRLMSRASVNTISDYNKKKPSKKLPYIVLMIDEFSDLMHMSKKIFQKKLCMLAQKSRACGIHIIIATQRPSVDVVTGIIKANFPARISCRVSSLADSRVILGCSGAEKLLGKGDSIINSLGYDMVRFQGAFITTDEINYHCSLHKRGGLFKSIFNWFRGI